jgi:uncharacterized protein involved in tolerance to divalent cations
MAAVDQNPKITLRRPPECLLEAHSDDTPEILLVPIKRGSSPYLAWIDAHTKA